MYISSFELFWYIRQLEELWLINIAYRKLYVCLPGKKIVLSNNTLTNSLNSFFAGSNGRRKKVCFVYTRTRNFREKKEIILIQGHVPPPPQVRNNIINLEERGKRYKIVGCCRFYFAHAVLDTHAERRRRNKTRLFR